MMKCVPRSLTRLQRGVNENSLTLPARQDRLVKKVLYGGLFPQSVKLLCDTYGLSVKSKKIEFEDFSKYYSKAIIATDLPNFELIVYLRSRQKKEYHKMVQAKDGHFKFERPTPPKVGFFLWLEVYPALTGNADYSPAARIIYHNTTAWEIKRFC